MHIRQLLARTLNAQLLTILGLIFVGMALLAGMVLQFVLWPAFLDLERTEARNNAQRVTEALSNELTHLQKAAADWAVWDETYNFALGNNPDYPAANLYYDAYVNVGHNLFAFYSTTGRKLYSLAFDLDSGEELTFSAFATDLAVSNALIAPSAAGSPVAGLLPTEFGLMWVATHPILRNGSEGPVGGYLIAGRLITPSLMDALRKQAHLNFSISVEDGQAEPLKPDANPWLDESDPSVIATFTSMPPLIGADRIVIRTETPRNITAIGRQTLMVAAITTVVVGTLLLCALTWLLRHVIVEPLRAVADHVLSVGRIGRLPPSCPLKRDDEIGVLARQFDATFKQLAEVRQRLLDQSYYSGMAEMSAGILHNVRNALSPATVGLGQLIETADNSLSPQLGRAIAELSDATVPNDRRQKLLEFTKLSLQQLNDDRGRMSANLQNVMQQLMQIEKILNSHISEDRSNRYLERIEIDEMISDVRGFVEFRRSAPILVSIDPDVGVAPPIVADRVILTQIVNNILLNAIEAIESAGVDSGRIEIRAVRETGQKDAVRLTFSDNGCGMDQATLERLFERGFTTKRKTAGGIGLHWCANSATGMAGRIFAESDGPGRGARIHLILPAVTELQEAAA